MVGTVEVIEGVREPAECPTAQGRNADLFRDVRGPRTRVAFQVLGGTLQRVHETVHQVAADLFEVVGDRVLNVLARLTDGPSPPSVATALTVATAPLADPQRYDTLRDAEVTHG